MLPCTAVGGIKENRLGVWRYFHSGSLCKYSLLQLFSWIMLWGQGCMRCPLTSTAYSPSVDSGWSLCRCALGIIVTYVMCLQSFQLLDGFLSRGLKEIDTASMWVAVKTLITFFPSKGNWEAWVLRCLLWPHPVCMQSADRPQFLKTIPVNKNRAMFTKLDDTLDMLYLGWLYLGGGAWYIQGGAWLYLGWSLVVFGVEPGFIRGVEPSCIHVPYSPSHCNVLACFIAASSTLGGQIYTPDEMITSYALLSIPGLTYSVTWLTRWVIESPYFLSCYSSRESTLAQC